MPRRNPHHDPVAGDLLRWGDWRIEIVARAGDVLTLRAKKKGEKCWHRRPEQTVEEFGKWAPEAKVVRRGVAETECVRLSNLAGPCPLCQKWINGNAHSSGETFCCEECCRICK